MTDGKIIPIVDRAGQQHGWRAIINDHWVSSQHRETLQKLLENRDGVDKSDYVINKGDAPKE